MPLIEEISNAPLPSSAAARADAPPPMRSLTDSEVMLLLWTGRDSLARRAVGGHMVQPRVAVG